MMEQIHILITYTVKIVFSLDAHGRNFYPVTILPVAARCGNLAKINLRIKIGGKRIAVVAAVAV